MPLEFCYVCKSEDIDRVGNVRVELQEYHINADLCTECLAYLVSRLALLLKDACAQIFD
jgi:hypothetical protein